MVHRSFQDATGKTSAERFARIRACFLEAIATSGLRRTELYDRPKPGDAREPTEREVVQRWAECFDVSINDIEIGIGRAFEGARGRGQVVTSFRYCEPQIVARVNELVREQANLREARTGRGPEYSIGTGETE